MTKRRTSSGRSLLLVVLSLVSWTVPCHAEDNTGLDIADGLVSSASAAEPDNSGQRRAFVEATASARSQSGALTQAQRVSFDYFLQAGFGTGLHGVVSGRLDKAWDSTSQEGSLGVHTLRELLVEWQGSSTWVIDAGRINAQFGEAIGFNPTDFFREGAQRSITSVLPSNLRNNRQGSVMLRIQRLWDDGALTMIGSPKLPGRSSSETFSTDLAATNPRNRWLIAVSQKIGTQVTPQFILAGGADQSTEVGFSVSWLPLSECVAYVEASLARRQSTLASVGAWPDDIRTRPKVAIGGTWNVSDTLSVNLELDVDSTAPDRDQTEMLADAPTEVLASFEQALRHDQNLLYQKQLFLSATWKNLLAPDADLRVLARIDAHSGRGQYWFELRKRFGAPELAAQFRIEPRAPFRESGARSKQLNLVANYYF